MCIRDSSCVVLEDLFINCLLDHWRPTLLNMVTVVFLDISNLFIFRAVFRSIVHDVLDFSVEVFKEAKTVFVRPEQGEVFNVLQYFDNIFVPIIKS